MLKKKWGTYVLAGAFTLMMTACGSSTETESTSESVDAPSDDPEPVEETVEMTDVKQVTNWFAQPEHGGLYAALEKGFYEENGMNMSIDQGGPQVSSIQIVASGQAQFGLAQADDILIARAEGVPIVAIGTIFQTSPQGLLFHNSQGITDFADLQGRKGIIQPGIGYWEYIKEFYDLDDVQEITFTGQFIDFIEDETSFTQGYVTQDPFNFEQQGLDTDYLLIHDSGYQPYANVMFTTEELIENNPELVSAYVEASVKGWEFYKENYDEINPVIQESNPDFPTDQLAFTAETLVTYAFEGDAAEHGFGYMSEERWTTLHEQLAELEIITPLDDVGASFTNDFLPGH
ncbi:hypothetical protein JCM9140_4427 [Halalkalibacter wakoensis JCM 9140]|uniref:SsuA/THI5-like domain-containing protein n=1 Tax=Halalkalibacter wakoensis JCM 9140 TaxID=1236970 RepID=W4Q8A2_9BACI|nr:ABC transporter substrate-binding protein [Halalkalibacter wakoensis]GAE28217.1 hypothetical protein JCM9140_4427 [Halalkalibacter wakoensis JCM 9140]